MDAKLYIVGNPPKRGVMLFIFHRTEHDHAFAEILDQLRRAGILDDDTRFVCAGFDLVHERIVDDDRKDALLITFVPFYFPDMAFNYTIINIDVDDLKKGE